MVNTTFIVTSGQCRVTFLINFFFGYCCSSCLEIFIFLLKLIFNVNLDVSLRLFNDSLHKIWCNNSDHCKQRTTILRFIYDFDYSFTILGTGVGLTIINSELDNHFDFKFEIGFLHCISLNDFDVAVCWAIGF